MVEIQSKCVRSSPPVMAKTDPGHSEVVINFQVGEVFQLILRVEATVDDRSAHEKKREDESEDEIVERVIYLVDPLDNHPSDVHHSHVDLVD